MGSNHLSAIKGEALALVDAVDHDPLVGAVIRGDASQEEYVRFLEATYHYVRWSGPLLAATAAGLERSGRAAWLAAVLSAKADEESPHDRWALEDLRRCGENVELVKAAGPPLAVQAYVDWSLSLAEAGSPAFLGSAYALELLSMGRAQAAAENLCARAAIPGVQGAVSFLTGHGVADPAHVAVLEDVLGKIDDPRDQADVRLSAAVLRRLYPCFFRPTGRPCFPAAARGR
jgi:hypothetical protein